MKNFKIYLLIGAICISTACQDLLETQPRQSIDSDIALTNNTGVTALLNATYAAFRAAGNYGTNRVVLPEILADNVINTTTNNNTWRTQETNQLNTGTGNWNDNYAIVLRTNLIIDAVDKGIISDATDAQKAQYKGEALFLRALAYFQLATSYGYLPNKEVSGFKLSVPIILTPTNSLQDVTFPTRNTNTEVYNQIKTDLTASIGLLTNTGRTGKAYASKAAAQALLSRVSLYLDDWTATISNANDVLNTATINGRATSVTTTGANLVAMWRQGQDKTEAIWEISFLAQDNLEVGSLQSWFSIFPKPVNATCTGNPTAASRGDLTVPQSFLTVYDAADIRRTQLIEGPYCKSGQTNTFFSNKYNGTGGAFGRDNVMVLRTSEILLNRAEAYARSNQTGPAVTDLNVIRTRAGLTPYVFSTQAALIAEIMLQRRLELAFEGHRWFDLIRTQSDIPKASGGLNPNGTTVPYNDRRILTPIPVAQIDVNKNLVQNPGY